MKFAFISCLLSIGEGIKTRDNSITELIENIQERSAIADKKFAAQSARILAKTDSYEDQEDSEY